MQLQIRNVRKEELPAHFSGDYCLRCLRFFENRVEIWTQDDIQRIPPRKPGLGYSEDFELYGPLRLLGTRAHPIIACQFALLAEDWPFPAVGCNAGCT